MKERGFALPFLLAGILLVLFIIGAVVLLVKKDNLPTIGNKALDTSSYTNVYSDGWHEYAFKYPKDATVGYSLGGLNREVFGEEGEIPNQALSVKTNPSGKGQNTFCSLEVSTLSRQGGDYGSVEDTTSTIELNGIQWKKNKYTSNPGSVLYEFKGVVWQSEKDNFRYVFGMQQDNEQWCESIISTFQFGVDSSVPAAQKAKMAKDAALMYAAKNYPNKIFVEGHFLYNTKGEQKLNVLDYTEKARVAISESTNSNYQNSVGIRLIETNNQWMVTGEVDPW